MDLENPTSAEAPLVALLRKDPAKMTEDELRQHTDEIRANRAIPATRAAARKQSEKKLQRDQQGIDLTMFE